MDNHVQLCVEDSGPGVPIEQRKYLFQKYHTSLEVVTHGNGIGLNLCKNLVRLLGGEIFLDESFDSGIQGCPGSRFVVRLKVPPLPFEKERATSQSCTSVGDSDSSLRGSVSLPKKYSILMIDDDAILRKLFIRSIKRVCPNWKVFGAKCGEDALKILVDGTKSGKDANEVPTKSFDLIFVDQFMASGSERCMLGTETVLQMRSQGVASRICGLSANDKEKEFLLAGADL